MVDETGELRCRNRKSLHPVTGQAANPFIKRLEHRDTIGAHLDPR